MVIFEVLCQKLLTISISRKLGVSLCLGRLWNFLFSLLEIYQIILWLEILVLTLSDPWCFRHWCIDLLEVEFALNLLLIDVWDHVWWLNKRHRERWTHPNSKATLCLGWCKIHGNRIKLRTKSTFGIKWFNNYSIVFILFNLSKVLEVDGQILIIFVS